MYPCHDQKVWLAFRVSEYMHCIMMFNSQSSTSYVEINRLVVKRAAVNRVVRVLQSKTVARIDGKRVLGLVKPGEGSTKGSPPISAVAAIAT